MQDRYTLHLGDCLESLKAMPDNSVDSIVTDPPYGLSFMGKRWDYDVPSEAIWREALRVLKPGGHLLAFAGTRTQHRMAVRIEDAGFEIRDMIAWVYGSGFPKSKNLDGDWQGWGTALKPALEPITVARKPFSQTVAANVLEHGTGALNIDGCRVAATGERLGGGGEKRATFEKSEGWSRPWMADSARTEAHAAKVSANVERATELGRWPANLIHDGSDEVLAAFPMQTSGSRAAGVREGMSFHGADGDGGPAIEGSSGSAARFFYCAKASRADRNSGLPSGDNPAVAAGATMREREDADWPARNGNHHPTVKPTDLMRYLCRLVTPPGGVVLDPFMGSGSTGKAAMLEGFKFIGCELSPEYLEISRARISSALASVTPPEPESAPKEDGEAEGQLDLFAA